MSREKGERLGVAAALIKMLWVSGLDGGSLSYIAAYRGTGHNTVAKKKSRIKNDIKNVQLSGIEKNVEEQDYVGNILPRIVIV